MRSAIDGLSASSRQSVGCAGTARAKLSIRHQRLTPRPFTENVMGVDSPCINICKFDEKTGFCIGCLRTRDECKQWKKMKDKHRVRIIDERPKRKAKLRKHGK